jgi:hypothetical protein
MLVSLKKRQTTTSNNQISHKEISDMRLIDRYQNSGYEAVADGVMDFFEQRQDLQRYAPGEGFRQWHCDWTISDEATEPGNRVLAWILYCDSVEEAGTEFHWQQHHEAAERGKLVIFPASPSHIHRGRVNNKLSKTIATGWINAGSREGFLKRLAR